MANLDKAIDWLTVRDSWRAHIGRLPRGYEPRRKVHDNPETLRRLASYLEAKRG